MTVADADPGADQWGTLTKVTSSSFLLLKYNNNNNGNNIYATAIHTTGSSSEKRRKNDSLINLIAAVVYFAGQRVATFTTAFLEFSVRATNYNLTGVLFGDYIR